MLAWAEIAGDPERTTRYKGVRGKGGFVRSHWDEVSELIAAAHVHTIKTYGPDRVVGFSPIPAMSMVSYSAGTRFLSVEEAAGDVGIGRGRQGDSRLVLSGSPAGVDRHPGIRQRDDGGLASSDDLASEDVGVEAGGAFDVGRGQEVGKEDALVWNGEPGHLSVFPRIVAC